MLKITGIKGLFQCLAMGALGLSLAACDDVTTWNQADSSSSSSSSSSSVSTIAFTGTVSGNTGTVTLYNNTAYICEIPYTASGSATSTTGKLCSATSTTPTTAGTFTLNLPKGLAYSVTFVGAQGQVCTAPSTTTANITGTVQSGTAPTTGSIPAVAISCLSSLNLKGTVSGLLAGATLTLSNNGVASPTAITTNTANNVTTLSAAATAGATTLSVASAAGLPVGATVLVDSEQMNITAVSGTTLTVTRGANGTVVADHASGRGVSSLLFTLFKATSAGYNLAVATQPSGQTCTFAGNPSVSGTQLTADITNIAVTCVVNSYSINGTISGLGTSAAVSLRVNGGSPVKFSANGSFAMGDNNKVLSGSTYLVDIAVQPSAQSVTPIDQTCLLANQSGSILNSDIFNVTVTCTTNTYTVSGAVSGLIAGKTLGLTVSNTGGAVATASVSVDGVFAFTPKLANGSYTVSVSSQPVGQTCALAGSSGAVTVSGAAVSSVVLSCTKNPYTIGGQVTGLPSGKSVVLNNGTDSITVNGSGTGTAAISFTFPSTVYTGDAFAVSIPGTGQPPLPLRCSVIAGASGTVVGSSITNVTVSCSETSYTINGTVAGLSSGSVTISNGINSLTLTANGTFSFPALAGGTAYTVTVTTQPTASRCTLTGSGVTGPLNSDVSAANLIVTCNNGVVSGTITGLTVDGLQLSLNGGTAQTYNTGASTFDFTTVLANGASYAVTVASAPTDFTCLVINGSGVISSGNVTNVSVQCAPTTYTISGTVANLPSGQSVTLQANASDTTPTVVSVNGAFTLTKQLVKNTAYTVAVATGGQPNGFTCTVTSGSGTIGTTNVVGVAVDCVTPATYTLGAALSSVPVGTATTPLASYLTINDGTRDRVVVYGNGNPVAGNGGITFGTPAAWAANLAAPNNSLVVNAGKLYLVNYGGTVGCTVGTTAPTATVLGTVQTIAATEQTVAVPPSTTPCTQAVTLTYIGAYSGSTAAVYTPFTYTTGTAYSLTITANPTNALCKLNGTNGIGVAYTGTFTNANVSVPVTCEYLASTISGTIIGYGTPKTEVVGGTTINASGTWTATTSTLTLTADPGGIQSGYQIWVETATGSGTYAATGMGLGGGTVAAVYVGSPYSSGTAVPLSSTQATNNAYIPGMAATTATNLRFIGGGTLVDYGMVFNVTGTDPSGAPINYSSTAVAGMSATFAVPTTTLFKAGTAYNVTIPTQPQYAVGSERTCEVYNGMGTVPAGVDSVPSINNVVIECRLSMSNARLVLGTTSDVKTTGALTAPAAPTLTGGGTALTQATPVPKALVVDPISSFSLLLNSPSSGTGTLSVLAINATTAAITLATATAPAVNSLTLGNQPFAVAIANGYMFATNTTDNTIVAATLAGNGTLTQIGTTTAVGTGSTAPRGVALHPSATYAYVVASGTNEVYQYTVGMTAQTALLNKAGTASSVATGTTPYNIAVDPSGRYAYVTNYGSGTVSMYSICQLTSSTCVAGTLSSLGTVNVAAGGAAVKPVYIAADTTSVLVVTEGGDVYHYAIGGTGTLTATANSVSVGPGVTSITLGSSRTQLYLATPTGIATYGYSSSGIGSAGTPMSISGALVAAYR